MASQITMLRSGVKRKLNTASVGVGLEITQATSVSKSVFVLQRLRKPGEFETEDVFAAVATPAQMQDFDERSPSSTTSFFRSNKVEIWAESAEYLDHVIESIIRELQNLVEDVEVLENLQPDTVYTITSGSITMHTGVAHTHYRQALMARPSGLNEVYTDVDGVERHRVGAPSTDLPGWLPCGIGDPGGFLFKYNMVQDLALQALWPPMEELLSGASLEINGVTRESVLVTAAGIFWKEDEFGQAPWPEDWVSSGFPGTPETKVTLVLDFLK